MKKAFKQALASGAGQPALLILALLAPARADPAGDLWRGEFAGQTKQELVRP